MGFIDHGEKVFREVIQETVWGFPGFPPINMARIVFNTGAETELFHHLEVICGAHADALGLQQFVGLFELSAPLVKLFSNGAHRSFHRLGGRGVVRGGKNAHCLFGGERLAG